MALDDYLPVLEDLRQRGSEAARLARLELGPLIDRAEAIANALADRESGLTQRVGVPFAEVLSVAEAFEAFADRFFDDLDLPPSLFAEIRDVQHALFRLDVVRQAFVAERGLSAGATGEAFVPGDQVLVPYQLRQGDTLERIAGQFLADPGRAGEIIDLNNLVYPFVDTERDLKPAEYDPSAYEATRFDTMPSPDRRGVPDGVLVTGETIMLPADAIVPAGRQTTTDADVVLYGRDLAVRDGVIQLTGDGADVVTLAGLANMEQALRARLDTLQGDLVLHPRYGMDRPLVLGIEGTAANVAIASLEMSRTILQDPRVVRVRDLESIFLGQDTANRVGMRVQLIGPGERSLPLNMVMPSGG